MLCLSQAGDLFTNYKCMLFRKKKLATGFIPDEIDERDANYEKVFGVSEEKIGTPQPQGRLGDVKESPLAEKKNILFQDSIPSCVCCSAAWINMYNSYFNDVNTVVHSWPYLFAKSPHLENGRRFRDVLQILRKEGVCKDMYFSQKNWQKGRVWIENIGNANKEAAEENARNYKIKSFSYISSRTGMYEALTKQPIMIAVGGCNADWKKSLIKQTRIDWYHAIVLLDVDWDGNMIVVNWWRGNKLDIRVLDKNYPITAMASLEDMPDGWHVLAYEGKLIKAKNSPEVFKVYEGQRYHIANEETYNVMHNGDWTKIVEIPIMDLEKIPREPKQIKIN